MKIQNHIEIMNSQDNKKKNTLKVIGTICVAGALAAVAMVNTVEMPSSTYFKQDLTSGDEIIAFNKFISKHHKSYITRQEYQARLSNF